MLRRLASCPGVVDCRIGSLEIWAVRETGIWFVDCRIGSLEMDVLNFPGAVRVDCRIGSLESS